jgi:hypothetical protein
MDAYLLPDLATTFQPAIAATTLLSGPQRALPVQAGRAGSCQRDLSQVPALCATLGNASRQPDNGTEAGMNLALPLEVVRSYLEPLIGTKDLARQGQRWIASLRNRDLAAVEPALTRLTVPTLIVWGTGDIFFRPRYAHWLRDTIPGVTEVVTIDGGRLFFPDERAADLVPHLCALGRARCRLAGGTAGGELSCRSAPYCAVRPAGVRLRYRAGRASKVHPVLLRGSNASCPAGLVLRVLVGVGTAAGRVCPGYRPALANFHSDDRRWMA